MLRHLITAIAITITITISIIFIVIAVIVIVIVIIVPAGTANPEDAAHDIIHMIRYNKLDHNMT